MKPIDLDHLLDIVAKFEQERGHKLVVKKIPQKNALKIGLKLMRVHFYNGGEHPQNNN
jgi:hypothetical protein